MKQKAILSVFLVAAFSVASLRGSSVIASVDGDKIDDVELNAKIAAEERKENRKLSADEQNAILESLINQRLLVILAKDEGVNKTDPVRRTLADAERDILSKVVYEQEVSSKVKVSDDEVKNFYDGHPQLFELRAVSQILVQPQAADGVDGAQKKAKRLKAQLLANPKLFASLAKTDSDDSASKGQGGDLKELRRGMMLKELEDAIFSAKPGTIVGPIQTKFGFHILYVRSSRTESFAEAKDQIGREIFNARAADLQKKLLDSLRTKYKVSYNKEK
jgi:peptidyl-prolyl cis-trans isomerase C